MIKPILKYLGIILFVSGMLLLVYTFYLVTINNQLNVYNSLLIFHAEKTFLSVLLQIMGTFMMVYGSDDGDL